MGLGCLGVLGFRSVPGQTDLVPWRRTSCPGGSRITKISRRLQGLGVAPSVQIWGSRTSGITRITRIPDLEIQSEILVILLILLAPG